MRFKTLFTFILLFPLIIQAQPWKSKPFSIGVLNNATLLPLKSLTAPFNQPLHPGAELTYEFFGSENFKNPMFRNVDTYALGGQRVYTGKWFQNIGVSYYYHQFVSQALLITTKGGYRKYLGKFSAEASLHTGYMHYFPLTEEFKNKSNGSWVSATRYGRPQMVGGAGIGIGYDAGYHYNTRRFFINYDFRLQFPFVKNYVTILPGGVLTAGVQFTLFKNPGSLLKPASKRLECPGTLPTLF